jgi:murein DD-endopeptidase MepM/ murein hydrolase activator NlpD
MDLTQLSQIVTWLDEEHRHDRDELAKLEQRLQSMALENQQQARRIQELEGRLASTNAQLTRFTQLEQSLQQLKNEVVVMLDKQTESRLAADREAERARSSDREAFSRSLAEIRKDLPRLGPIEEELSTRQAEDQRLGDMVLALRQAVNNLAKDFDERTRTLPYMAEQRAQDNKRIAQIQAENVELLKRSDALASKASMVEERVQRLEIETQRLEPIPDQLRQEQHNFIEAQKLADTERVRQMAGWAEDFARQQELIEKQVARLREFEKRYEAAGRALKSLEEFQGQLARDQKQVAELQRLAEERQRKELAAWQTENEQRWKKETLRWDYTLQEQQKVNQKLTERFGPTEKSTALLQREVEALWRLHEALAGRSQSDAQKLLDTVGAALQGRPKPE